MDTRRIEQALSRLDAALKRAEDAAEALPRGGPDPDEYEGLRQRHDHLKETVANSLRQLDEILAGMPQ